MRKLTAQKLLGALAICTLGLACGQNNAANNSTNNAKPEQNLELRRAILSDLGQKVILKTYSDFEAHAKALDAAAAAWAAAPEDADKRAAAQTAFLTAAQTWQHAELMLIGPAGPMSSIAGGEDLRDLIYAWPLNNACRVDIEITTQSYADAQAFANARINVRGLDALEYLLFGDSEQNTCSTQHPINAEDTWDALTSQERLTRRAAYAAAAAKQLSADATTLHQAWSPQGQDYLSTLTQAGQGSARYGSTQEALNALSDAMFYLEKETKDMKLGPPLGLIGCTSDCGVNLTLLESQHANASLSHIKANLAAFKLLYQGGPSPEDKGFDDLLIAVNQASLASDFAADIDATISAFEAIDQELHLALPQSPEAATQAFEKLRALVTRFRTEFISVLDLELPQRAEGDND